jgi:hypothetical protein
VDHVDARLAREEQPREMSVPGCAFARATSSATLETPTSFETATSSGAFVQREIGTKSFGPYLNSLKTACRLP